MIKMNETVVAFLTFHEKYLYCNLKQYKSKHNQNIVSVKL